LSTAKPTDSSRDTTMGFAPLNPSYALPAGFNSPALGTI
jgi:hypothetical protein